MTVSGIEILRDGGTILFRIHDSPLAGSYQLRTPFDGEPRLIHRDGAALAVGSVEESRLSDELQHWLDTQLTPSVRATLSKLEGLREWRNLPDELVQVIPLVRIRGVIERLRGRSHAKA